MVLFLACHFTFIFSDVQTVRTTPDIQITWNCDWLSTIEAKSQGMRHPGCRWFWRMLNLFRQEMRHSGQKDKSRVGREEKKKR